MDYAQTRCQDGAVDAESAVAVGKELGRARRALRISKREAARRAGVAEITWRQYEDGQRQIAPGQFVPVNPRDEKLEAAAGAVGLDPKPLFELAGRLYDGATPEPTNMNRYPGAAALSGKIERLPESKRRAIEALVDEMLGPE